MMNLSPTSEEIEALKSFLEDENKAMNQLLVSNAETDIVLFRDDAENETLSISYNREAIISTLIKIKALYTLILKQYYKSNNKVSEFFKATKSIESTNNKIVSNLNKPACINVKLNSNIPYLIVKDVLEDSEDEVLIVPFTRVKKIELCEEKELENSRNINVYNMELERQELQELSDSERFGLYSYILENAYLVEKKLKECVKLDKENEINYENIRKLEQLLIKYENTVEDEEIDTEDSNISSETDYDTIERINRELNELKEITTNIFETRKENIDFINSWKRNISVYMIAECCEIEKKFSDFEEKNPIVKRVRTESRENIKVSEQLLHDIKLLITKQQNHARIAGNIGSNYSALNNAFEMKKNAENMYELLQKVDSKIREVEDDEEKLENISKVNIEISTLLNYLNNPKIALKNSKVTRFEEMAIIEENELKRGIAERIREIRGEAELKKLKDDLEIIEAKTSFSKFLGFFTGQNKLDEFMIEQIEVRQKAIRKNLLQKLNLAYNYSVHELLAEIELFVEINEDDDLVEEDVLELKQIGKELRKNYIISESKVHSIAQKKSGKNLPVDSRKVSKFEMIEIETYRFLNKFGYDIELNSDEPKYQDTMANEISRIVEYINSSKIL